jgi:hypothetical protein
MSQMTGLKTVFREPIDCTLSEICTFSFGANMSAQSLINRGVVSLRQARGVLYNHKLVFDIKLDCCIEGGERPLNNAYIYSED